MANERLLDLKASPKEMIKALVGGNPGALSVCCELFELTPRVDPDALLKGTGTLMGLDSENIWEERIWMLYKDVCGEDLRKTIAILRASQLGIIRSGDLHHAIDNRGEGLDVDAACAQVKKRLPRFELQDPLMKIGELAAPDPAKEGEGR